MSTFTNEQIALGAYRLNELADFLADLPREKFDYASVVQTPAAQKVPTCGVEALANCGTTCCAMGWMPAIWPQDWRWGPIWSSYSGFFRYSSLERCLSGGYELDDELAGWFALQSDICETIFYSLTDHPIWPDLGLDYARTLPPSALVAVLRLAAQKPLESSKDLTTAWQAWDNEMEKAAIYADIRDATMKYHGI